MSKKLIQVKEYLKLKYAKDKIESEILVIKSSLKSILTKEETVEVPRKIGPYRGVYLKEEPRKNVDQLAVIKNLTLDEKEEFFKEELKLTPEGKNAFESGHKGLLKCVKEKITTKLMSIKAEK